MSSDGPSYSQDTIAAVATAPGRGGVGIVRVSGPGISTIARSVIGHLPKPRYASLVRFLGDDGTALDQGLALYFKGPDSFTGEDVLELQGHGGPVVLDMLLKRIVGLGARIAEPGEFSKRAFLNDKLDLTQAEAIADLISSGTAQAARSAMRSLEGRFSDLIAELLATVIEVRVFVEAAIDFPDEEVDYLGDDRVEKQLSDIRRRLKDVISEANLGALLSEGASVVLLGKPNAGKSSLMNRLTGRETSIVTHIPGTTRDIVGDIFQLDGIPLRLIDTAGIRRTGDAIETEGVRRAVAASEQADLVIAVVDASLDKPQQKLDLEELEAASGAGMVIVSNKIDLAGAGAYEGIAVSAKTGEGMEALKTNLKKHLGVDGSTESGFTARTRHVNALEQALAAVDKGHGELTRNGAGELLAEELRFCQRHLEEITGEFSADDLLGEIFSTFCIGK
ncbi:MAG: tRNA uridine-5-carboxymethylaminomethyl(34) synthesis GTPase MnmE [Gammaproteobacteria bacterium]|nr:tRNA uridine-5-carboxymethylaminomethyl(34) synthesis GTPase MnmE [Gammaproteobacteria bacterium]MBT7371746.1 tRNA uridine-5-carboxymethylaminomethyl(34) synthesis GTPase MnmE [Gammaproteobacteria bacterium]